MRIQYAQAYIIFIDLEGRRLAVLRSHLQPAAPAGEGDRDVVVCAEQAAGVSTSPCSAAAAGGGREAEGKSCVFCRIIRGEAPAFKVRSF
jgi:hypothetical protein